MPGTCTEKVVIIFTKYPHPGFAKTRLIPAVGAARAADISRRLSERCVATVRSYCAASGAWAVVYYAATGGDERTMREWLAPEGPDASLAFQAQCEGDLGDRLKAAFSASFVRHGSEGQSCGRRVVVVGVDIPELCVEVLEKAFETLCQRDAVIGPAEDGGYYLLGMREPMLGVFDGIEWGSSTVFGTTETNFRRLGLSWDKLVVLRDIDLPEDLEYYRSIVESFDGDVKVEKDREHGSGSGKV